MIGLTTSHKVKPNAAGDWQIMPPPGIFTQIGNAGGPASGLILGPDDFHGSGKVEANNNLCLIGVTPTEALRLASHLDLDAEADMIVEEARGGRLFSAKITEEVTIPIGQGAAGVWGAEAMNPGPAIILSVMSRITQAPGGGATLLDIGRWGPGNPDEYLSNGTVNLGDTSDSATDGDGVNAGPVYQDIDTVLLYTTNNNVTISDMKVRLTTYYMEFFPPT